MSDHAAPPRVVVMGPAGAGKTTLGTALAAALRVPFLDADDLHPAANRARMQSGQPLDDRARAPWLAAVHAQLAAAPHGLVVACSALRQRYRERLGEQLPDLRFVYLRADRALLAARLAARPGHFFPAALLDDQLHTLEPPRSAIELDASRPVAELVATAVARLAAERGDR
jgi:carbohydrate kinase (thermoresistant glucokinase family)